MFVMTCPKCQKRLHLPDSKRGKHVRCAGCQGIVQVSTDPTTDAPPLAREVTPLPPQPLAPSGRDEEPAMEHKPVAGAVPGLLCARCEAEAVVEMPPDANSRKPGYVCAMCRTVMRPAGSKGNYFAAAFLGAVIVLLGISLTVVALDARRTRGQLLGGGAALTVLGGVVSGWGVAQARLPVPKMALAPPARTGFWIVVVLIAILLAGGGAFGMIHVMQEMK